MNPFNLAVAVGLLLFAGASLITNTPAKLVVLAGSVVAFFVAVLAAAGVVA
jgi:hypothetical protein